MSESWRQPGNVLTVVWCAGMFLPNQAIVPQGSFAVMLAWFIGLSLVCETCGPSWSWFLLAAQLITLSTTWLVPNTTVKGP